MLGQTTYFLNAANCSDATLAGTAIRYSENGCAPALPWNGQGMKSPNAPEGDPYLVCELTSA